MPTSASLSAKPERPSRECGHSRSFYHFRNSLKLEPVNRVELALNLSKSRVLQTTLNLGAFHERLPHTPGPIVLDHNQDRPLVDAQHFRVPPAGGQIER